MSRVGKLPVGIPKGVNVQIDKDSALLVKGPKGILELSIHPSIALEIEDEKIVVKPKSTSKQARSLYGLTRTLIANMVEGVTNGYTKKLVIVGIGYKASIAGGILTLNLGFSHPVQYQIPAGIEVAIDKQTNIFIKGIDKQKVGQVAAEIRGFKPPEPYKGKGIRYEGEFVRRKVGKSGA
ncbi:MAG: 50S ribosomal protein L6 [Thermoplasmata archaeon]|nr:MAG: 50S ribosomal protein L6 [Thermoplasmata archaeon]